MTAYTRVEASFKQNNMKNEIGNIVCDRCSVNQIIWDRSLFHIKIYFSSFEAGNCVGNSSFSKHTTTFYSLSDHYILSRERRVIFHIVQTNYDGRPMIL